MAGKTKPKTSAIISLDNVSTEHKEALCMLLKNTNINVKQTSQRYAPYQIMEFIDNKPWEKMGIVLMSPDRYIVGESEKTLNKFLEERGDNCLVYFLSNYPERSARRFEKGTHYNKFMVNPSVPLLNYFVIMKEIFNRTFGGNVTPVLTSQLNAFFDLQVKSDKKLLKRIGEDPEINQSICFHRNILIGNFPEVIEYQKRKK